MKKLRLLALGLAVAMCVSIVPLNNAMATTVGKYQLGNSITNLLNGGVLTEQGSDIDAYLDTNDYRGVNVFDDHIYYIDSQHSIKQVEKSTGRINKLYDTAGTIQELCVVNDEDIYYLEDGNVYQLSDSTVAAESMSYDIEESNTVDTSVVEESVDIEAVSVDEIADEDTVSADVEAVDNTEAVEPVETEEPVDTGAVEVSVAAETTVVEAPISTETAYENLLVKGTGDIKAFVPTAYGMVYVRGSLFTWDIYAEDTLIASNVYQYCEEDGYLIYTVEGSEYQISLQEMFNGGSVETYSLGETIDVQELFSKEDGTECEVCEQQSHLFTEERYEESLQLGPGQADPGMISAYSTAGLTNQQKTIIQRAEDQASIPWTAKSTISSWKGRSSFVQGQDYKGIPYGQPVSAGKYVGFACTLDEFKTQANTEGSLFYTKQSYYSGNSGSYSPYYATDCSAFVSYAWGIQRTTTYYIPNVTTKQPSTIYAMQVGDGLVNVQEHAILIEDIEYSSTGDLVSITTIEETPPITLRTKWSGHSGYYSLDNLQAYFTMKNYGLYRYAKDSNPSVGATAAKPSDGKTVYRLYSPITKEHLYTIDVNERNTLYYNYGWIYEGVAWVGMAPGTGTPVYRVYSPTLKQHLYTTDTNEVAVLTSKYGWVKDNNGKPLFYSGGDKPIYRVYNKLNAMHHLTSDYNEYKTLPKYGWLQEGTALYATEVGTKNISLEYKKTYTRLD